MPSYPSVAIQAYEQLLAYTVRYPEEVGRVREAGLQIHRSPSDVCSRTNMEGHITTSALVIAVCDRGVPHALPIHHKSLQRWQTPGGHLELGDDIQGGGIHRRLTPAFRTISSFVPDPTLWDAVVREVNEETGVRDVEPLPFWKRGAAKGGMLQESSLHGLPCVFDIDTHSIPKNAAKGEGAHVHHDFMFLGKAPSLLYLKPLLAEINGARWMPAVQLASLCIPPDRSGTTQAAPA